MTDRTHRIVRRSVVALALAATLGLTGIATADQHKDKGNKAQTSGAAVTLGKYEARKAFADSGYRQKLQQKIQQSRKNNKGDRRKAAQAARQAQQDLIGKFRKDVKAVAPKVADQAGVDAIIQGEVLHTNKKVNTKDITSDVIKALKGRNGGGKKKGGYKSKKKGGK